MEKGETLRERQRVSHLLGVLSPVNSQWLHQGRKEREREREREKENLVKSPIGTNKCGSRFEKEFHSVLIFGYLFSLIYLTKHIEMYQS